jgi:hypothetical protein
LSAADGHAGEELADDAVGDERRDVARADAIKEGIRDGSIPGDVDAKACAEP